MAEFMQVFRAEVAPENVAALLEVRPAAIAQAREVCPALVRAELVRLDERTWLDLLVWDAPDGAQQLMAKAADLPLLHQMHSLVSEVASAELGEVAHSTAL